MARLPFRWVSATVSAEFHPYASSASFLCDADPSAAELRNPASGALGLLRRQVRRSHAGKKRNMRARLFVGNLSFETNELQLRDLFAQLGQVLDVKVVTDRESGRSRGFAFIDMINAEDADKAIAEFNGRELDGRTLRVSEAASRASA